MMQGYMEVLTMAEDEWTGTDDNMLVSDDEKSQRRELSPGRAPPSAVPQQPAGPLDGLHVFTILHDRGPLATNGQRRAQQLQSMNL